MAELFRSDDMWSALADTLAPFFHPKFRVWFAAQREGWDRLFEAYGHLYHRRTP